MAEASLLLLVGLTGAGKSTLLRDLCRERPEACCLPDRRTLADTVVLPEAQRLSGLPRGPVADRVERFRLTRLYREHHPGGMVHALERYLEDPAVELPTGPVVFDGLRGEAEVRAAIPAFPTARFVLVDASRDVRVARLAGRADAFDGVANGATDAARRIVDEEERNYGADATRAALQEGLAAERWLHLDTERLPPDAASERLRAWLGAS